MEMKEALRKYFERLEEAWDGSHPLIPYDGKSKLYVSEPDEDGEAEWVPLEIKKINIKRANELNDELIEFFSSYYYMRMDGRYKNCDLCFEEMSSNKKINQVIDIGLKDAVEYLNKKNFFCLAAATYRGNDEVLAFYDMETKTVFLYDMDKERILRWRYPLIEIIENMKALI